MSGQEIKEFILGLITLILIGLTIGVVLFLGA